MDGFFPVFISILLASAVDEAHCYSTPGLNHSKHATNSKKMGSHFKPEISHTIGSKCSWKTVPYQLAVQPGVGETTPSSGVDSRGGIKRESDTMKKNRASIGWLGHVLTALAVFIFVSKNKKKILCASIWIFLKKYAHWCEFCEKLNLKSSWSSSISGSKLH